MQKNCNSVIPDLVRKKLYLSVKKLLPFYFICICNSSLLFGFFFFFFRFLRCAWLLLFLQLKTQQRLYQDNGLNILCNSPYILNFTEMIENQARQLSPHSLGHIPRPKESCKESDYQVGMVLYRYINWQLQLNSALHPRCQKCEEAVLDPLEQPMLHPSITKGPLCHHTEQKDSSSRPGLITNPQNHEVYKIGFYFKPLSLEVACYIAVNN